MDPFVERQCNIDGKDTKNPTDVGTVTDYEKSDHSPENSRKSDYSPLDDHVCTEPLAAKNVDRRKMQSSNCSSYKEVRDGHSVNKSMSMQEIKKDQRCSSEDPDVRNALAFTIDFSDGRKSIDAQRHEKMLERFQNRHKRGVSLSKLESGPPPGKIKTPQSVNLPRKNKNNLPDMQTDVKLRDKNKSTKDAISKRHSWSPRTSMTEVTAKESVIQMKDGNKFTPRSTTLQMAFDQQNITKDACSSSEFNAESLDSSIGLLCVEPPLENFGKDDDGESVSEAGTYTLDGDNYTEEQKERMNIDRMPASNPKTTTKHFLPTGLSIDTSPRRPTNFHDELEIIDLDQPIFGKTDERRKPNILEVTYFHDSSGMQPMKSKQSYLEKLKSRVKNITHKSKSPDKAVYSQQVDSSDQGTFTSVTTSGILSIKPSLENRSGMQRRNSLTKSHIDSSEYVQGVAKLNIHKHEEAKILNCYTDSQKATGLSNYNKNYDSPRHKTSSDASAIGSVASKKDWIQEWAKNAREYSKNPVQKSNSNNSNMTRSYDFENSNQFGYDFDIDMTKSDYYDAKKYEEFGDNLDRQHLYRKQLDRLLNDSCGSEPLIKQGYNNEVSSSFNEFTRRGSMRQYTNPNAAKPPMSPSKIPSPIGSVGRARSVSRNRSLQGSNSDLSTNETEMYLQKTAAAICTLQDLHRRNSLRCTSLHNSSHSSPQSPASRRISPKISPMNSLQSPVHHSYQDKALNLESQQYSPHHQQLRNIKHHHHHQQQQQHLNSINHKRNLSLDDSESYVNALSNLGFGNQMSNSLNTENMNAVIDFKKQHTRHNSFEGMSSLPPKPVKCFQNFDQTNAYYREPLNDGLIIGNDVDDEDDESLLVVTTGVGDLFLDAKKTGLSIKQQITLTGGKSSTIQSKTTGGVTNRSGNSKSVPFQMSSPIKRSSSFSVKAMKPTTPTLTPKLDSKIGGTRIQKSASSTSFKKMVANVANDNDDKFYINDDDDLELDPDYSSNSDFSDKDEETGDIDKEPITNTRYNKTFLMRMEQNKKIAAGIKQGVAACPNTPELPRRTLQVRGAVRDRASMPRDSSLNRMKQDLHLSRKSVGKEFASKESIPAAGTAGYQRVQPKYMDISKYKIPNAGTFLKKDESKSYLMKQDVKKSPSSTSVTMSRIEPSRMSTRSVKSAGTKVSTCAKKDAQKQMKEQELEMWRRRASYDPMKAAMEGKRKQEEARRQAQLHTERLTPS
ncbi:uncharacterized protein LOC129765307 isoform X2 [Toxorhynchites rutilus septentrionalis]|uniref:uncharacterized protein LOC129765307 isoform X2 n=1 Tax=Toxorhynchites rutilus septentrionalis TaxID=329112 RepID=UPI002478A2B2|nr:uncharacterized protein LOC129765307 isoform X2 [Toxorhynchites rutilus septentrionalis]